jgi:hypothetical protein
MTNIKETQKMITQVVINLTMMAIERKGNERVKDYPVERITKGTLRRTRKNERNDVINVNDTTTMMIPMEAVRRLLIRISDAIVDGINERKKKIGMAQIIADTNGRQLITTMTANVAVMN